MGGDSMKDTAAEEKVEIRVTVHNKPTQFVMFTYVGSYKVHRVILGGLIHTCGATPNVTVAELWELGLLLLHIHTLADYPYTRIQIKTYDTYGGSWLIALELHI